MEYYEALEAVLAFGIAIILILLIVLIAWLVYYYMGFWKLFKKAGKPGWYALVPFFNTYALTEIVGLHWAWAVAAIGVSILGGLIGGIVATLLSLVGLFINVNIYYNLCKKMNKEIAWVVLLTLFGGIVLPILGYNSDEFNTSAEVNEHGLLDAMGITSKTQPAATQPAQEDATVKTEAPAEPAGEEKKEDK